MTTIAIYARKSRFSVRSESVATQITLCREHCQRLFPDASFQIYGADEGYSGKNTDRPDFQRLVDDIKARKINAVCVYRLEDKQKAVSYLNIAEKGRIKEASYLLAEAAFERRAFKTCLRHIDQYLLYNTGQHQNEIARLIKLCDQFPKMTQQIEDVLILDSVIVHRDKMLEAIKLHPACGELSAWKGKTAYLNEKGERCYTSDSVAGRGFDIFLYNKMPDNWEREQLDGQLNSAYNEAYPYLLSDGITIYFASDAPGGLGGYDLYISRYNTVSETR